MKLTFLGTAASEGFPYPLCRCPFCRRARELGGPSLRKRSSALVNNDLLIDLGPDLIAACQMHGVDLTNLRYGLQTHEHGDHLDARHFHFRDPGYGLGDIPHFDYYASQGALDRAAALLDMPLPAGGLLSSELARRWNFTAHAVVPWQTFAVGPYRVTSVPAVHNPEIVPLLYAIERDGRALFYGTDTAPLPDATLRELRARGLRFDVAVLDHTFSLQEAPSPRHMTRGQFLAQVERLRAAGLLASSARVIAHHFAHHCTPVYPELVALATPHGYEIAYDGLVVTV